MGSTISSSFLLNIYAYGHKKYRRFCRLKRKRSAPFPERTFCSILFVFDTAESESVFSGFKTTAASSSVTLTWDAVEGARSV